MSLTDIIVRLEKAERSSNVLDVAIWELVEADPTIYRRTPANQPRYSDWEKCHDGEWRDFYPSLNAKPYTSSIDAALTLLPEWCSYELTRSAAGEPTFTRCRLWDWRRSPLALDPHNEWKSEGGNRPLPINICIAALIARGAT